MNTTLNGTPTLNSNNPATDCVLVDPEFERLIPPLSRAERCNLESRLRADGRCLEPLVVWKGHHILLDGHNRLEICRKWGLAFDIVEIELPDRDAAKAWIIAHQRDKRNLGRLGQSYLRGLLYLLAKQKQGGNGANQHQKEQTAQNELFAPGTAQRLSAELKVSPATIKRDAQLAQAVHDIEANVGEHVKKLLLSPDSGLDRRDILWLADLEPTIQRRVVDSWQATGHFERLGQPGVEGKKMVVPRQPQALAHTLVNRLDLQSARQAYEEFGKALKARERAEKQAAAEHKG